MTKEIFNKKMLQIWSKFKKNTNKGVSASIEQLRNDLIQLSDEAGIKVGELMFALSLLEHAYKASLRNEARGDIHGEVYHDLYQGVNVNLNYAFSMCDNETWGELGMNIPPDLTGLEVEWYGEFECNRCLVGSEWLEYKKEESKRLEALFS